MKLHFCRYLKKKHNQYTRARHLIKYSQFAQPHKLLEFLAWCKIDVFNQYFFQMIIAACRLYPCKASQALAPCDAPRLNTIRYHMMCSNSCFWVWGLPVSIPASTDIHENLKGSSKTFTKLWNPVVSFMVLFIFKSTPACPVWAKISYWLNTGDEAVIGFGVGCGMRISNMTITVRVS